MIVVATVFAPFGQSMKKHKEGGAKKMAYINGNKIPAILRKGDKGDNAFIRYSANADGTDFTEKRHEGQNYIGFATGQTAPTDKSAYEWGFFDLAEHEVVQSTGDSPTAVMSQKAVTETAFLLKNDTAQSVNNLLRFDLDSWKRISLGAVGEEIPCDQQRMAHADFVELKPNTTYRIKLFNNEYKAWLVIYKEGGVYSTQSPGWIYTDYTFTTDSESHFIKLLVARVDDADFTMIEGILNCGLCLVEETTDETAFILLNNNAKANNNLLRFDLDFWKRGSLDGNGEEILSGDNRMITVGMFELNPKTKYNFKFFNNEYKIWYYLCNANGVVASRSTSWELNDFSFMTPEEYYYIKLLVGRRDDADFTMSDGIVQCGLCLVEEKEGQDVFISGTNNQLNTNDVTTAFRITDDSPYFVENPGGAVISHPIYVEGKEYITLKSNSYSPLTRWIAFCKDLSTNADSVVSVVEGFLLETDGGVKTVPVPQGAIYAFVTLRTEAGDSAWVNDTIAYGKVATDDAYIKKGIVALDGNLLMSVTSSAEGYNDVLKDETNRFNRAFVPFSVGSPNDYVTYDKQYERANILFFTDSHIDIPTPAESLQNVKDTIDFANKSPVPLDAVINGGDAFAPYGNTKESAKAIINKFFAELKNCGTPTIFAKGNHDTNDYANPPTNAFNDNDWGEMWLDYAEEKYGIVRQTKSNGNKSTWHYYDIADKKIRVIAIDVQDTDKTATDGNGHVLHYGGVSWYISQEQMTWLVNTALNFDDKEDKGWGVIVVTHQSHNYSTTLTPKFDSAIFEFLKVCVAFNKQTTYTSNFTFPSNSFFNLSINADFTRYASSSNKPHIICWLIGHEHTDQYENVEGINLIWLANGSANNWSSDDRLARVIGTATQNCFDVLNIDTVKRKIRCFRFGAGVNCYGVGGDRFLPDGLSY